MESHAWLFPAPGTGQEMIPIAPHGNMIGLTVSVHETYGYRTSILGHKVGGNKARTL